MRSYTAILAALSVLASVGTTFASGPWAAFYDGYNCRDNAVQGWNPSARRSLPDGIGSPAARAAAAAADDDLLARQGYGDCVTFAGGAAISAGLWAYSSYGTTCSVYASSDCSGNYQSVGSKAPGFGAGTSIEYCTDLSLPSFSARCYSGY